MEDGFDLLDGLDGGNPVTRAMARGLREQLRRRTGSVDDHEERVRWAKEQLRDTESSLRRARVLMIVSAVGLPLLAVPEVAGLGAVCLLTAAVAMLVRAWHGLKLKSRQTQYEQARQDLQRAITREQRREAGSRRWTRGKRTAGSSDDDGGN